MYDDDGKPPPTHRRVTSTYRPTGLDRSLSGSLTVNVFGPIHGLDLRTAAERMRHLRSLPRSRTTLRPHDDRWYFDASADARGVVSVHEETWTTLDQLVDIALDHAVAGGEPITVLVSGGHLAVAVDHAVGDSALVLLLSGILGDAPDGRSLGAMTATDLPVARLRRESLKLLAPRHVRAVLRVRDKYTPNTTADPGRRAPAGWRHSRGVTHALMSPRTATAFRAYAERQWNSPSQAAVSVALLSRALRDAGLPMNDTVLMPVDCRRYLPARYRTTMGNAAVTVPIGGIDTTDPHAVATAIREVLDSRWPLASFATTDIRSRLLPRRGASPGPTTDTHVPATVTLAYSDVGKPRALLDVPFGDRPGLAAYTDPADAGGITVCSVRGVWGTSFGASYHADIVDGFAVREALTAATSHPIDLFE
ncbi:hypothetical protein DW322_07590 [Rhodococcus rhodnii]|uniref:Condensation domain-containing protein n=2 Tax=Rhodococcus rhodnii TaxID=38312 RepID=R7WQV2_9NOCA|nr:hypothetical protein [Rhodococcus rhodnii]EOM77670.1 hypothetical protein Rrhod_0962 [Rhodococcus rhodnii LMG 5362]TXG90103.1 hypothetical protein DW322_07590 [Rhodococcus rhodnii]